MTAFIRNFKVQVGQSITMIDAINTKEARIKASTWKKENQLKGSMSLKLETMTRTTDGRVFTIKRKR